MIPTHRFTTPLQVWRRVTADDTGGGQTTEWVQAGTVFGQVSQPSADDRRVAQQSGGELAHVVHCHPSADVKRDDRLIVPDGRDLKVAVTTVPSQQRYLRVECWSVQAGG